MRTTPLEPTPAQEAPRITAEDILRAKGHSSEFAKEFLSSGIEPRPELPLQHDPLEMLRRLDVNPTAKQRALATGGRANAIQGDPGTAVEEAVHETKPFSPLAPQTAPEMSVEQKPIYTASFQTEVGKFKAVFDGEYFEFRIWDEDGSRWNHPDSWESDKALGHLAALFMLTYGAQVTRS